MKYCEKLFSFLFKSQCLSWYFFKIIYKKSFLIVAINNILLAISCCFFNLRLSMSICLNMFEYLQIVVSQLMRGLKNNCLIYQPSETQRVKTRFGCVEKTEYRVNKWPPAGKPTLKWIQRSGKGRKTGIINLCFCFSSIIWFSSGSENFFREIPFSFVFSWT